MISILEQLDQFGLLISTAAVIGLCVGSFSNVVISRLPRMMEQSWRNECQLLLNGESDAEEPLTLSKPASHCPKCKSQVRPWQNIPVLSWLLLRGKCNSCDNPISIQYPLVELATAFLVAASFWAFGPTWQAVLMAVMSVILVILIVIDLQTQLLPDTLTLGLLWFALAVHLTGSTKVGLEEAVIGAIAGYGVFWSVLTAFKLATGKEGMGGGDLKLLAALGACLGWEMLPLIVFISAVGGSIAGMSIPHYRKGNPMPFGPWLAMAGLIAAFFGNDILTWYLGKF